MTNVKNFATSTTTLTPSMQHGKENQTEKNPQNVMIIAAEEW